MEVLLVRILVFVVVLTSPYAMEQIPGPCEIETVKALKELVEVQREKGDTLKEIVETQRRKDDTSLLQSRWSEELKNLEESQSELSLALKKIVNRLDVIEAKSVDKQQNLEEKQNKLSQALNKLVDRLDVVEAGINTESDQMNVRLDVIRKNYEEVLQRVEDIEKVKSQIREVSITECKAPFERVGKDCVHWIDEGKTWGEAQSYCATLGGRLIVPTIKEGFELAYGDSPMSNPHPPLFDFLSVKKSTSFYGWIGATVDKDNNARWTTGEELKRGSNRLSGNDREKCIAAYVASNFKYATWTADCSSKFATPVCQKKYAK